MNREQQDYVWSILPKEFKEEVKQIYNADDPIVFPEENELFDYIFGEHNLTSDADGEDEMLCVSRKQVQEMYNRYFGNALEPVSRIRLRKELQDLFGSKCLPDEVVVAENATTTEPKLRFKEYDTVRVKKGCESYNELIEIMAVDESDKSSTYLGDDGEWYAESDLEPYTEPEASTFTETCTDDCQSPRKEVAKMKPIEFIISVYLATAEEDKEFRQLLHENGFEWADGDSLIDSREWSSAFEEDKIHFVYPDKTVTYCGDRTSDTLTFSEFKRQYFEAEPEETNRTKVSYSSNSVAKSEMVDGIIKDSFSKERRLNIATQMVKAIMQCPEAVERIASAEADSLLDDILHDALYLTDRLIAECEKGGKS